MSESSAIKSIPNDKKIKSAVNLILQNCDFTTMTMKSLRFELEKKYNCSFDGKKDVIREELEKYLEENADVVEYSDKINTEKLQLKNKEGIKNDANLSEVKIQKKGFSAVVQLSNDLSEFLGISLLPRTEVTKRVWIYIKDRREILCDVALEKVLKRKTVNMFKMTKILSTLMKSYDELQSGLYEELSDDEEKKDGKQTKTKCKNISSTSNSKSIVCTKSSQNNTNTSSSSSVSNKKRKTISYVATPSKSTVSCIISSNKKFKTDNKPVQKQSTISNYIITEGLANVLNISQQESRPQVVAKMWEYIRQHNLQNPQDKRQVILDKTLQDIFKVKQFTIFSMNKYIAEQMHKNI